MVFTLDCRYLKLAHAYSWKSFSVKCQSDSNLAHLASGIFFHSSFPMCNIQKTATYTKKNTVIGGVKDIFFTKFKSMFVKLFV